VDGNRTSGWCHTNSEPNPWWQVDLEGTYALSQIVIYNRADEYGAREATIGAMVSSDGQHWTRIYSHDGSNFRILRINAGNRTARYVRLQLAGTDYLNLLEVEVYGTSSAQPGAVSLTPASERGLEGTMKDYNGTAYKTIRIGSQVWMAENLKVKNYRNGDPIPNVTDPEQWGKARTGAYCSYNNSSVNADIYGYLYNWYAATDKRNIAPAGWHVPNNKDWTILIDQLGGEAAAGNKLKETGIVHWKSPNLGATNESGFTGLPDGRRAGDLGGFWFLNTNSNWWSTDEMDLSSARCRPMTVNSPESIWGYDRKNSGLSIRLVKDDNSATTSSTPLAAPPIEVSVFDSMNIEAVANKPTAPATFNIRRPHVITSIMTYHWNDGRGTRTGTIALRDASGLTYGPWPVTGTPGQGGVPNAVWTCNPNVKVPAGTYTIVDSEPVTWSQNPRSSGRGMAAVKGYPID
jgi:uncharacterized protein (TIGR02145 family)